MAAVPSGFNWISLQGGCYLEKKIQNWPIGPRTGRSVHVGTVRGKQGSAAGSPQTLASPGVVSDVLHAYGDGMINELCSKQALLVP